MIAQRYKDMLSGKSVIRQISEWSTARGTEIGYENVFDYSLGNPSVPCPEHFTKTCIDLLQTKEPVTLHGYSPTLTIPAVRKAVAESLNRRFGMDYTSDHIFMTTGAAGALGVDLLARKDAKHLFILGAGKQAPFQIAATLLLRPAIDKVYIADPMFPDNAVQFAAHIAQQLSDDFGIDASGVEFLPALDMASAVGDSDAIITVTPSRKPIIQKAWLKPGTHLSCLGSDMESKQEIESTIFQGAAFYADDRAQCIRVGEMELPIKQGVISADDITGEIGDLIDGKVPGRTSDTQTTIFDATGLYILDAAKVAIDRALAEGVGLQADL